MQTSATYHASVRLMSQHEEASHVSKHAGQHQSCPLLFRCQIPIDAMHRCACATNPPCRTAAGCFHQFPLVAAAHHLHHVKSTRSAKPQPIHATPSQYDTRCNPTSPTLGCKSHVGCEATQTPTGQGLSGTCQGCAFCTTASACYARRGTVR